MPDMPESGRVAAHEKRKLYVANLSSTFTEEDLMRHFSEFGEVSEAHVLNRVGRGGRLSAFVIFAQPEAAQHAVSMLQNWCPEGDGQKVTIKLADAKGTFEEPPESIAKRKPPYKLYVSNLPSNSTPEYVKEIFEGYGKITDCHMLYSRGRGNRRSCFLTFEQAQAAAKALTQLADQFFDDDQRLTVRWAEPASSKSNNVSPGLGPQQSSQARRDAETFGQKSVNDLRAQNMGGKGQRDGRVNMQPGKKKPGPGTSASRAALMEAANAPPFIPSGAGGNGGFGGNFNNLQNALMQNLNMGAGLGGLGGLGGGGGLGGYQQTAQLMQLLAQGNGVGGNDFNAAAGLGGLGGMLSQNSVNAGGLGGGNFGPGSNAGGGGFKKLAVENIDTAWTQETLNKVFSNYGLVKDSALYTKKGKPKQSGWVVMQNADTALVQLMNSGLGLDLRHVTDDAAAPHGGQGGRGMGSGANLTTGFI